MQNNSYTATIEVAQSPEVVFNHINDVSKWWVKDIEGKSTSLNDEFIVRAQCMHYSKHKLIEAIPNKKVVWLVTESKLDWIENDMTEWTGTKMVFELTPEGNKTVINFTHEGLVPEKECYANCKEGWNMFIKERLYNLITNGAGKSNI